VRQDAAGDLWRLSAAGSAGSPFVAADGRQPATLSFGEPFTAALSGQPGLTEWKRGKEDVRLSFALSGAGDDRVSDISRTPAKRPKNDEVDSTRPPPPAFEVLKPDGEIIARGSFEYG